MSEQIQSFLLLGTVASRVDHFVPSTPFLQIDCKLRMKISKYLIWLCPNKEYGQVYSTNSNKENSSFPSFYHHCNANNFFQNWFSSHAQIESCVYTNIKLGRKYFPAQNANAGRRAKVLPSYHSHTRKWALIQFGRFIQTVVVSEIEANHKNQQTKNGKIKWNHQLFWSLESPSKCNFILRSHDFVIWHTHTGAHARLVAVMHKQLCAF